MSCPGLRWTGRDGARPLLLTGLYPPDTGEVLLGGIPLPCYRQEALNRHILCVSQDEKLLLVIDHTWGGERPFTREFHFENGELHISELQERNVTP